MSWPELKKAKGNSDEIGDEIARLMKASNSLTKKEIARHPDTLTAHLDESIRKITEECREMILNLKSHRKYIITKARFMKRHYRSV